uniref:ubiquitinyl hydrolase 1 n=1 Tax=Strix occidentalis caurina TaxID=311401 RepID=A0A8D0FPS4_STROC
PPELAPINALSVPAAPRPIRALLPPPAQSAGSRVVAGATPVPPPPPPSLPAGLRAGGTSGRAAGQWRLGEGAAGQWARGRRVRRKRRKGSEACGCRRQARLCLQQEHRFEKALREKKGFIIKRMKEDGACLFRAVADQVYGDQDMHEVVRKHCMDYLMKNADYFSNYVTEDFTTYINRKRKSTCHGNHIEMQAMAEMYNRPVEVYQYGTEPINTFHGIQHNEDEPIRVSYHRNIHYNSVVNPNKATIGVGLGLPSFKPGLAEQSLMKSAIKTSEESWIEQQMLEDKKRATDWEATNEAIEEQVDDEILASVLAVSQQEYLETMKTSRHRDPTADKS